MKEIKWEMLEIIKANQEILEKIEQNFMTEITEDKINELRAKWEETQKIKLQNNKYFNANPDQISFRV